MQQCQVTRQNKLYPNIAPVSQESCYSRFQNLFNTPPLTCENIEPMTLLATVFALPNLSHLVKAMQLVQLNDNATATRIKYKNSNFKTAMIAKTTHAAGTAYINIQKM